MSGVESLVTSDISVYLSYDPDSPPSHPGSQWTRFVCLSDTHSKSFSVPNGDVLLHSGDLSSFGRISQLQPTMDWINALPHPTKILIAGNHDLSLDTEWYQRNWSKFHRKKENVKAAKDLLTGDKAHRSCVVYLEYSSVEIQAKPRGRKWKVYGCPGSPWFGGWAFNYERGDDAKGIHQAIPNDTDILLTHGPPDSILDVVHDGTHVGCEELLKRVEAVRPALHVFGHIHEDRGAQVREWPSASESSMNGRQRTVFINAANMPSGQKAALVRMRGASPSVGGPGFQPIIVDLYDPTDKESLV